jgi:hypothetical protein
MMWKMGVGAALNRQSGFVGEVEQLGVKDFTGNEEEKGIGTD